MAMCKVIGSFDIIFNMDDVLLLDLLIVSYVYSTEGYYWTGV